MRRSLMGVVAGVVVAGLTAVSAAPAAAQETGTPVFKAPYRTFDQYEFGASFTDPGGATNFSLEGFYTYGYRQFDLSVRGGFEDLKGDTGTRYLLGGDLRTRFLSYSDRIPVDASLTLGFGANVGTGRDVYYVPIGVSVGRRFNLENSQTTFVPYLQPVLVPTFGGGESDVDLALGVGVDLRFSRSLGLRVSGGLGDIEGVGVSIAFVH
ncbi:MAG TPA: hypothetical protein VFW66_00270 [Gemmatimonadales bacterium]|nr:hypothetical protein [Gemmatimonadales bacterium]